MYGHSSSQMKANILIDRVVLPFQFKKAPSQLLTCVDRIQRYLAVEFKRCAPYQTECDRFRLGHAWTWSTTYVNLFALVCSLVEKEVSYSYDFIENQFSIKVRFFELWLSNTHTLWTKLISKKRDFLAESLVDSFIMDRSKRVFTFLTFLLCTLSLTLLAGSLATQNWIHARPIRLQLFNSTATNSIQSQDSSKFRGEIHFGLFQSTKILNYGFGNRVSHQWSKCRQLFVGFWWFILMKQFSLK